VFRMRWVLEIFLEMNECTRGLDQSFEKNVVVGVGIEPKLFQDVVRFVITLLVPTAKIGAIERMIRYFAREIGVSALEAADELRNPFAFVHEAFNFTMPPMMGKPTFPEGTEIVRCQEQE
jgi:hypothetical protein